MDPIPSNSPNPPYDFSSLDLWVAQLASHHLTWMPILDDTPWWAKTCVGMCPPMSMTWYATFAKAVAARYGPGGSFWLRNPALPHYPVQYFEIWNEENNEFWSTGPSAAQYAAMYSQARTAIHAVDPGARVIVGGLGTGDAFYFVQGMLAADPSLRGNIDGFGLHQYADTAAGAMQLVVWFREGLDALGEGSVPIDLTEFGWPTGGPGGEIWRAQMMSQLAIARVLTAASGYSLRTYGSIGCPLLGSQDQLTRYRSRWKRRKARSVRHRGRFWLVLARNDPECHGV